MLRLLPRKASVDSPDERGDATRGGSAEDRCDGTVSSNGAAVRWREEREVPPAVREVSERYQRGTNCGGARGQLRRGGLLGAVATVKRWETRGSTGFGAQVRSGGKGTGGSLVSNASYCHSHHHCYRHSYHHCYSHSYRRDSRDGMTPVGVRVEIVDLLGSSAAHRGVAGEL